MRCYIVFWVIFQDFKDNWFLKYLCQCLLLKLPELTKPLLIATTPPPNTSPMTNSIANCHDNPRIAIFGTRGLRTSSTILNFDSVCVIIDPLLLVASLAFSVPLCPMIQCDQLQLESNNYNFSNTLNWTEGAAKMCSIKKVFLKIS